MDHSNSIIVDDVILRPLARQDIEALRIWRNDSLNSKYIRKIPYITPEQQQRWFESYLADESIMAFSILEKDGVLRGSVSLYDFDGRDAVEFGKLMVGEGKGRKIGSKATIGALRIAFENVGVDKVVAEVSVENTAALIIYIRIGFVITGRRYNAEAEMDEYSIEITRDRFYRLN